MTGDAAVPQAGGQAVGGRVLGAGGRRGLPDLVVEVVDCGVGGDVGVGESHTDADGAFTVLLAGQRPMPDLQVRVWTSGEPGATLVGASTVALDAAEPLVTIDVHLAASSAGLESEHDALLRTTAPFVPGRLGDLEESQVRSDVTRVATKAGWDARGVAYAALADRLARETGGAVPDALLYALLRAGAPPAPDALFRTSLRVVEATWRDAVTQGLVPRHLEERIPEALRAYETEAARRLLSSRAGMSSVAELLDVTFPDDDEAKATVAEMHVRAGSADLLWDSLRDVLGPEGARRLELDSRLAALTLGNAPLVAALHASQDADDAGPLRSVDELARRSFHRPDRWAALLSDTARAVPEEVAGDTAERRLVGYAEYLAAQVRLGHPTAVLAARIAAGDLAVDDDVEVSDAAAAFLSDHAGRFELGVEPVRSFVATNDDVEAPHDARVLRALERVQRLYQVTPDDDAMAVLLDAGLDSATAIADVPVEEFVRGRGEALGEPDARLVHARAEQISDLVANLAGSYLVARTAPRIGVDGAMVAPYDDARPRVDVAALPTLERLFGSLDTEACEHCGSVLSPAAYLVDLLHHLDIQDAATNPLDELLKRRPDIGHLPLTCENTSTVVPHIDLVTETLEYFVAHGRSLEGFTGHTTPVGQTAEQALATPAFVDDEAYAALREAMHPAPLPFHRHLEDLRALLTRLGTPLAEVMRVLRRDDELTHADGYGWREIAHEQAGISPQLAELLTDHRVPLPALLGLPATATVEDALAGLATVRGWAAHLDLTYDEVHQLLGTRLLGATLVAVPPTAPPGGPHPLPAYDELVVRHVAGDAAVGPVTAADARLTIRLVRLWRALGWSIGTTDAVLVALLGPSAPGDVVGDSEAGQDAAMERAVARVGTVITALRRLGLEADALEPLVACWSDLEPGRPAGLYQRLFLAGGAAAAGFEPDADGLVLTDAPALADRADVVSAALRVTPEELAVASRALGPEPRLTLAALSELFRRTWLARTLGMRQQELDRLLRLTGIDPFDPPDQPDAGMLRLLDVLDTFAAAHVAPSAVVAALWPTAATAPGAVDPMVRTVARDVRRRARATVPGGAGDVPVDRLVELLVLRFGDAGRHLAALVDHALDVEVPFEHLGRALPPAVVRAGAGRLRLDADRRRLGYAGRMSQEVREAIRAVPDAPGTLPAAVDELFAAGEARATDVAFASLDAALTRALQDHPEFVAAWLDLLLGATEDVAGMVDALLGALRSRERREEALAAVAAATGVTTELAGALLDEPGPLGTARSGLVAVADVGVEGLARADLPGGSTSSGLVDVVRAGPYRFGVRAAPDARVTLRVDGRDVPLVVDGDRRRAVAPVELAADRLVPVVVEVQGEGTRADLEWRRGDEAWTAVPADALYTSEQVATLREVLARLVAAAGIGDTFALEPAALRHLLGREALGVDGTSWLSRVPVLGVPDEPALGDVVDALGGFAALATAHRVDQRTLVGLLLDPEATLAGAGPVLAHAFGWQPADLAVLLAHRALTPAALAEVTQLARVAAAMASSSVLAVPMADLLAAITPDPGPEAVGVARTALRRRYGGSWLDALRDVTDGLRVRRRDALVAYVLRELRQQDPDVDTPEKLFEFFLMDVATQPAVATSRVRHAISAVQLFVERVLMNLGPVPPETFTNPERWQHLKRYRLWEASRQLFLWPENWLEPQLRTDQSPAFRRVMSQLLQSDIGEESAATALLGYLSQLEEVAKLEPVAIHEDEGDPAFGDEVSHVVARTPGAQRRYFYRRRETGTWTAWEHVGLDIEDNPAMPVLWKGRLLLFWLKVVNTSPPMPGLDPSVSARPLTEVSLGELQDPSARNPKVEPKVVLCWSEYYDRTWLPPRTSDVAAPSSLLQVVDITGPHAFDRREVLLGSTIEGGVLRIRVWGPGFGTSFLFFNTYSLPQRQEDSPDPDAIMALEDFADAVRDIEDVGSTVTVTYRGLDLEGPVVRRLFTRDDGTPYRITAPFHVGYQVDGDQQGLIRDPWLTPFLYADGQHAFFVRTTSPRTDRPGPRVGGVLPPIEVGPRRGLWSPDDVLVLRSEGLVTADRLVGAPGNLVLDGVEISPLGRTSAVVPTTQEVHRG
ncbi:hypothetical protein ICW40_02800 [Actinotalea ferrariae]|uniref:neuraminidase-like domain-containing protein n=1 Tax=Actinotalea ferrariae TaxID=1386098 RepID=UPI001C8B7B01|nr:neuraminidase-like domain-containing protein [Actinotalea ferrariae]MBX9243732.1 hypothetical protein [Actinotalea ferrariae]